MLSMNHSRVSTNEEPLTRAKFRKLLGNRNTDSAEVCASQTPRGTQSSPRFAYLLALLCAVIASLLTTTAANHTDDPQPLAEDKSNSHKIATFVIFQFVNTFVIVAVMREGVVVIATIVLGMMEVVAVLLFAHIVASNMLVLGMMEDVAALLLIGYLVLMYSLIGLYMLASSGIWRLLDQRKK
ncbi:hypothetical protein CYMTET_23848 [Cymbomonas tetramitiformis]|uniref:Uncharacterized protein n=1 Tax=Cymbomonas tetramitiformis TaxID=36881 RepID=A0AAE0BXQ3_9CHLO|nr:hypothetical protein CYMTET_46437 [Cymbomonas tetramitiformis]KAK3267607.1 hypothetical protein CYMTET_23848 [Cymbomonas tetramitiformis]